MASPQELLRQYWGYEHFRPLQEEIVRAVAAGRDTLAVLPTGGGKSVCYQVPALLQEGLCIVITPLIALMEDQVLQLKKRGIPAVAVHAGMSRHQLDVALDNCIYGPVKLLYCSPERLQTELFQARVVQMKINLIAVDEAHCISQWGYDFRPAYLKIGVLRELRVEAPILALTATANKRVREDIVKQLALHTPEVFVKSFLREHLSLVVRRTENKEKMLTEIIRKVPGTAIVYVRSRNETEKLTRLLKKNNISGIFYHAGLDYATRNKHQQSWISGGVRVMVATNAFGMGIDKADVRLVIHVDLPESIEAYYQEAGRAGRDGKRAYAVIVGNEADDVNLRTKVLESQPDMEFLRKTYQGLANYFQLAEGSSQGEGFEFYLEDFCKRFSEKPLRVYAALKKLEEAGLIQFNDSFYQPSRIFIQSSKKHLYEFQVANEKFDPVIKTLLRLYGAEMFATYVPISENQVATTIKATAGEVKALLKQLDHLQVIHYQPATDAPRIIFVMPRQDADRLPIDRVMMEARRDLHIRQMESMIKYVTQSQRCRMQVIQDYFDEETFSTCGICDVCIDKRKQESAEQIKDYRNEILLVLKQQSMTAEELEQRISPTDHELFVDVLREMLDEELLRYDEYWVLFVKS